MERREEKEHDCEGGGDRQKGEDCGVKKDPKGKE